MQQLASLYHGKSTGLLGAFSVGGSGPPPQPSLQAHLFSSVAALGALLAVLVTLDQVVTQNECLREAWGAYKGMIAYARADPAAFQASEVRFLHPLPPREHLLYVHIRTLYVCQEQTARFERLLVAVDAKVMRAEVPIRPLCAVSASAPLLTPL